MSGFFPVFEYIAHTLRLCRSLVSSNKVSGKYRRYQRNQNSHSSLCCSSLHSASPLPVQLYGVDRASAALARGPRLVWELETEKTVEIGGRSRSAALRLIRRQHVLDQIDLHVHLPSQRSRPSVTAHGVQRRSHPPTSVPRPLLQTAPEAPGRAGCARQRDSWTTKSRMGNRAAPAVTRPPRIHRPASPHHSPPYPHPHLHPPRGHRSR